MLSHPPPRSGRCLLSLPRRDFLAIAGASALGWQAGTLAFPGLAAGVEPTGFGRARVRALFVRPEREQFFMSWPGASFDPEAAQAEYIKVLTRAAEKLDVQLEVHPVPLHSPESVTQTLADLKQYPCDGLLITVMHLQAWPQAEHLVKHRGTTPVLVFSPLGTSFAEKYQGLRRVPRTFVAATPDHGWLATGLRMLRTTADLQQARLCIVTDAARGERRIDSLGVTLCFVPLARWVEEYDKAELTEEMREIAKYYSIEAKTIVEPEKDDIFNAAKNYVVARRLMAAERCQGISVDCGPLLGQRRVSCGPCLAWSRMLDEGRVGACEGDTDAAVSLLLVARLCDRPGWMQDPAPNTVNNTFIGSHCTCATRLDGYDRPHLPFTLRTQFESNTGVALRVLWRPHQDVTIMKFQAPGAMLLGSGHVVENVEATACGGCRTAVEIQLDNVADARDVKGHHQVLVAGRFGNLFRAYGELAGIQVVPI